MLSNVPISCGGPRVRFVAEPAREKMAQQRHREGTLPNPASVSVLYPTMRSPILTLTGVRRHAVRGRRALMTRRISSASRFGERVPPLRVAPGVSSSTAWAAPRGPAPLSGEFGASDIRTRAAGRRSEWYPYSFPRPLTDNAPGSFCALSCPGLCATLQQNPLGQRIVLLGFSHGACLRARIARVIRIVLRGRWTERRLTFAGTPDAIPDVSTARLFLGSAMSIHYPLARVKESAGVYRQLGASVDELIYSGMYIRQSR